MEKFITVIERQKLIDAAVNKVICDPYPAIYKQSFPTEADYQYALKMRSKVRSGDLTDAQKSEYVSMLRSYGLKDFEILRAIVTSDSNYRVEAEKYVYPESMIRSANQSSNNGLTDSCNRN